MESQQSNPSGRDSQSVPPSGPFIDGILSTDVPLPNPETFFRPHPEAVKVREAAISSAAKSRESLLKSPPPSPAPNITVTPGVTTTPAPKRTAPKKSHAVAILVSVLSILLLAVVASVLYISYFQGKKTAETNQPGSLPTPVSLNASDAIAAVIKALPSATTDTGHAAMAIPAPYKVSGYDFYTMPLTTAHYTVFSSKQAADAAKSFETAQNVLIAIGLKSTLQPGNGITYATLESDAIHCRLNNSVTGDINEMLVACADAKDYESIAKTAQPFYAIITKEQPQLIANKQIIFSPRATQKSATEKYSLTSYDIREKTAASGVVAHFFQTPDGTWQLFKVGGTKFACSDYVTPDHKNAYAGITCTDPAGKDAVVTL